MFSNIRLIPVNLSPLSFLYPDFSQTEPADTISIIILLQNSNLKKYFTDLGEKFQEVRRRVWE
jgi:hypothetical protein